MDKRAFPFAAQLAVVVFPVAPQFHKVRTADCIDEGVEDERDQLGGSRLDEPLPVQDKRCAVVPFRPSSLLCEAHRISLCHLCGSSSENFFDLRAMFSSCLAGVPLLPARDRYMDR